MIQKIIAVWFIVFAAFYGMGASAQESPFVKDKMSLTMTGGTFGYSNYTGAIFSTDLSGEYFVADNLSIGFATLIHHEVGFKEWGIGPSASYYFWKHKNWFSRASLTAQYVRAEVGGHPEDFLRVRGDLGVGYLIVPNFSIGLALGFDRKWIEDAKIPGEPQQDHLSLQLTYLW
jgi:hypothetical protein